MPVPSGVLVTLQPSRVLYITPTAHGDRTIVVDLYNGTTDPRIMAYARILRSNGPEETPIMVAMSEVEAYVRDARGRLGVGGMVQ